MGQSQQKRLKRSNQMEEENQVMWCPRSQERKPRKKEASATVPRVPNRSSKWRAEK